MSCPIHGFFVIEEGTLSSQLSSQAVALANKEVARVLQENGSSTKFHRGKMTYSILDN